jgi:hypothetical protein
VADEITGAGSATAPVAGGNFGFAPGAASAASPLTPAPAAPVAAAPEAKPEVPVEKGPSLAEVIRQERESRKAREQESARAKDLETKYSELRAEMERVKRDSDFEADPVAYARARGWDKEKQVLMGQTLLYDLVPDKAPPDLRIRLFESKQARERRESQEQAEKARTEQAQAAEQEQYHTFVTAVDRAAGSFESGSFPESESWFGEDHDTYVRSLVATAINMASAAQQNGQVADLSPAAIARTLEAEVARKMKARDDRAQKRAKPVAPAQQETQAGGGMQPTESTKGTYGSGAPRPKAVSDAERVARAIAVMNKPR